MVGGVLQKFPVVIREGLFRGRLYGHVLGAEGARSGLCPLEVEGPPAPGLKERLLGNPREVPVDSRCFPGSGRNVPGARFPLLAGGGSLGRGPNLQGVPRLESGP